MCIRDRQEIAQGRLLLCSVATISIHGGCMKITTILMAALSLAFLAACDRGEPRPKLSAPSPAASGSSAAPQSQSPTTPANTAAPSEREKKDGASPVQGQVDPKDGAQSKDFQHPDTGGK